MSLNDFAPYIQFLAAFYLSLAFEKLIERFFFTPTLEKKLNEIYDTVKNQFNLDDAKTADFKSRIEERKERIVTLTRKVSTFCFPICLILLLVAALEISLPPSTFSWEKNSWLGYWWLFVVVCITVPALICIFYGYIYFFIRIPNVRNKIREINFEMTRNIYLFMLNRPNECSKSFQASILEQFSKRDTFNKSEIMDAVKKNYSHKCFKDLCELL